MKLVYTLVIIRLVKLPTMKVNVCILVSRTNFSRTCLDVAGFFSLPVKI